MTLQSIFENFISKISQHYSALLYYLSFSLWTSSMEVKTIQDTQKRAIKGFSRHFVVLFPVVFVGGGFPTAPRFITTQDIMQCFLTFFFIHGTLLLLQNSLAAPLSFNLPINRRQVHKLAAPRGSAAPWLRTTENTSLRVCVQRTRWCI